MRPPPVQLLFPPRRGAGMLHFPFSSMLALEKFSIGVGDRFGRAANAQLLACERIEGDGVEVVPVWNKSVREHTLIGSEPAGVLAAAQAAVAELDWRKGWHVDADHIRFETVDPFIPHADFFTIDVADAIGRPAPATAVAAFLGAHPELIGALEIPALTEPIAIDRTQVEQIARKYLLATQEAGRIYRHLAAGKGVAHMIAEVSMDETDTPQTPSELLVILTALADEKIRLQTIAPKFTGRFNKGVDYVGDLAQFEREFRDDLAVIAFAIERYGLPKNLKLSIHSGSDKFSLYPIIGRALRDTGAGVHLKTAGTTWLEELIGLAEAGGDALRFATELYAEAVAHLEELCAPYATVIDIDRSALPDSAVVASWSSEEFAAALRHEPDHPGFNPSMRQLLHVGFKLAAKQMNRYLELLAIHRSRVSANVTANLYRRHLRPLFVENGTAAESPPAQASR